ncbi:MAG: J domain-containing protein [Treponemataceae bacterium]
MDSMFDKLGSLLNDYIENPSTIEDSSKVKVINFTQNLKDDILNKTAVNNMQLNTDSSNQNKKEQKKTFKTEHILHKNEKNTDNSKSYKIHRNIKAVPKNLVQDFKLLGISPPGNMEICRKAYKNMLKKYHPDKYIKNPSDFEKATLITIKVTESFRRIKDWLENS